MADNSSNGQSTAKKILTDNGKELAKELSKNAMRAGAIAAGKIIVKKSLPIIAGIGVKIIAITL